MPRVLAVVAALVAAPVLLLGLLVVAAVDAPGLGATLPGSSGPGSPGTRDPGGPGATGPPVDRSPAVPPTWESLDQRAAVTCPGLDWSVLAAIGRVESDSGRSTLPGVASGANGAGAEGPMQFEPSTFAAFATVGPGGAEPPSPYDPVDAVFTAARLLCADGAGSPAGLWRAVWEYDHLTTYVETVLVLATALAADPGLDGAAATALAFAAAGLGVPYRWGGTGPGGFDCSGLAQAAERAAGVALPRVAQDQFDAGPAVPTGAGVDPGDLVFFGTGPTGISHVGLYVGFGVMIDAPHSGADVRIESAGWSDLVGATRPD